ncbi:MAG: hypothetical protein V3V05_05060, partial [Pontiella sp.]
MKKLIGIVLCLLLGATTFAQELSTANDGVVDTLEDLRSLFEEHQTDWIPLAFPGEATLFQDYGLVVPFRTATLPKKFINRLAGEYNQDGIPIYEITAWEDPDTRQVSFFDTIHGTELYRMKADPYHDPYAFLRWKYGLSAQDSFDGIDFLEILRLDSAKVSARFTMVPAVFYADYILAEEQRRLTKAVSVPMMMAMSLPETVTNLMVGISNNFDQIDLELKWPVGFTNGLEIFACENLLSNDWRIVSPRLSTTGLDSIIWQDSSTNLAMRFFQSGDADTDTDGDFLTDAQEIIITKSDVQKTDTDNDGLTDREEIRWESYAVESTVFDWVDIESPENTVSNWTNGLSNGYAPAVIGFNFNFYENTFSNIYIACNGFLCLGAPSKTPWNHPLPGIFGPANLVAAFWDDLDLGGNTNAAVYVDTLGSAPARRTVVTWKNVSHNYDAMARITFQIELRENDDIIYRYLDMYNGTEDYASGGSATVGLQDGTGEDGTLWSYNVSGSLTNGRACKGGYRTGSIIDDIEHRIITQLPCIRIKYALNPNGGKAH